MNYAATRERLREYRDKIVALRKEMRATQAAVEPEPVRCGPMGSTVFTSTSQTVRRSSSFPATSLACSTNSLPIADGGFRW